MNQEYTIFNPEVAVVRCKNATYPSKAPFHPDTPYPESLFAGHISNKPNYVYRAVRHAFHLLNLDSENYGTKSWNPLSAVIRPGDRVIIKPNYVLHAHLSNLKYESIVTHSAVLRAVIDYVLKAIETNGKVMVADAPLRDADFDEIKRKCQIDEVLAFYQGQGYDIELLDMRLLKVGQRDGFVVWRDYNPEQLSNSRLVDIGDASAFNEIEPLMHRVVGADYNRRDTSCHHSNGHHEYCISSQILDADVVLNVGKLKTHKKCGVSLSMKNLVGINVDKNYLPHYRIGMPSQGGDEYPERSGLYQRFCQWLIRSGIDFFLVHADRLSVPVLRRILRVIPQPKKGETYAKEYDSSDHPGHSQKMIERFYSFMLGSNIRDGNWFGNDTTWRMVLDLNTILLYSNNGGLLQDEPVRRCFSIIDGIIGGAGEGPMNPVPMESGVILAGFNPLSVDFSAAQLMGFDPEQLKVLSKAQNRSRPLGPEQEPIIKTNDPDWSQGLTPGNSLRFCPPPHWENIQAWY